VGGGESQPLFDSVELACDGNATRNAAVLAVSVSSNVTVYGRDDQLFSLATDIRHARPGTRRWRSGERSSPGLFHQVGARHESVRRDRHLRSRSRIDDHCRLCEILAGVSLRVR